MKKYLMLGCTVALFAACSNHDIAYQDPDQAKYETAFINTFGQPAANHTWGFGSSTRAAFTRSQATPTVLEANQPYDADWVANYLTTATEPDATNSWDNHDNSTYATNWGEGGPNSIDYSDPDQKRDRDYFCGDDGNQDSWETRLAWALANHPTWVTYTADATYITNFKIEGTYNGYINVVTTEAADGDPRTVVVTGTWNLTENQRVGGNGKIIVANGGKIVISEGKILSSVNEAQIVVLPGGEISGAGSIEFSNGTSNDLLSGNWGTINVGKFNNNGGNFFNYGTLNTDVMDGGAANSCYYNHGKVNVGNSGSSANIRIYNNCQWNVTGNFRLKMLENCSYFHVGGRLQTIGSEDGTGQDAYVALGNNSLLDAQSLHNTGTNWYGPTGSLEEAYAVVDFGSIYQLDWAPGENTNALQNGYFANNIYVNIHNQDNAILGSAGSQTAKQVFWSVIANGQGQGNGNVTEITDGDNEIIYGDEDFVLGTNGCKPSYTADVPGGPEPDEPDPVTYELRVMAEDLSAQQNSDFDFNDVVFDAVIKDGKTYIKLWAAGGTLPLYIGTEAYEVHGLFKVGTGTMVNTYENKHYEYEPVEFVINQAWSSIGEIPVMVQKGGEWKPINAYTGMPAAKFGCPVGTEWADEFQDIDTKWDGAFKIWVGNEQKPFWADWNKE